MGVGLLAEAPNFHPIGEQNFIKSLINFDKDNISDKVLKKIGAYCAQPDFQPDIIGRVSLAAKSLCMWVRAMEVSSGGMGWGAVRQAWEGGDAHRRKLGEWKTQVRRKLAGEWVSKRTTAWPSLCRCMGGCIGW